MINLSESTRFILFTILEFFIIVGSLGVVFVPAIIYSALLLSFVFICIALLYLLLNADFLAAAQILIYVGAINVLIVFAIMLVDKQGIDKIRISNLGELLSGCSITGIFIFFINTIFSTPWYSIVNSNNNKNTSISTIVEPIPETIQIVGFYLLTDLLLPFELLSLLLLIALLGAITIARKQEPTIQNK